jgi:hypothetical protein
MLCCRPAAAVLLLLASTFAFASSSRLPDGSEFPTWEKPLHFTRTYYVSAGAAEASDSNPGTEQRPWRTISHAAEVLEPGERVVIASGTYREAIHPARGGSGPEAMISYEAAPGATVVVKGSAAITHLEPSTGFNLGTDPATHQAYTAWEIHLDPKLFPSGYNPFAVDNVLGNRFWLDYAHDNMATYFRRRGLVFVDGKPLEPVESPANLAADSSRSLNFFSDIHWSPLFKEFSPEVGRFWVEPNGMTLHLRLNSGEDPNKHLVEITNQEQVFSPAQRFQAYIRVKGITFQHAGNGFPVPQRGMVSVNRGNHFIFEGDTFEWANSVGLDIGNEDWAASRPLSPVGFDVVRDNTFRFCGIEGLGGTGGPQDTLVEKNLFEWIGWQDAALMSESGGTKMHVAHNLLFRNNVVRHIRHANGIWLDIGNQNVRITGNVFADIPGHVNPHGVHIEGSDALNQIDNNIFADLTGGILIRDTNHVIIAYNLFLNCAEVCVDTMSGINGPRPVNGHTNDVHDLQVHGNIFVHPGRSAIEWTNSKNDADGNVYPAPQTGVPGGREPYLRVKTPEPPEWDNLQSWREQHGWDMHGVELPLSGSLNADTLELKLSIGGELPRAPAYKGIDTDFFGHVVAGERLAGPFAEPESSAARHVDPR